MDVDGEEDSKKKLDQRKKELVKQIRNIDDEFHRHAAECGGRVQREVATGTARHRAKTR